MKDNILNLPSDVLGNIFKEIYSEYEKSIRKMFSAPPCEIEITAQQVAKAFDKRGLIEYAPQLYIFVAGVFIGIKDRCNPYQETTVFQPISDEQYREYRKLCYLRPIRAKNYLLDLVNFDGTPYNRGDFQFIGKDDEPTKAMIALWQEIEKSLLNRDNQHP